MELKKIIFLLGCSELWRSESPASGGDERSWNRPGQRGTITKINNVCRGSVVDPHHVDADTDSTYHPDADPDSDSDFYLIRIRIRIFI